MTNPQISGSIDSPATKIGSEGELRKYSSKNCAPFKCVDFFVASGIGVHPKARRSTVLKELEEEFRLFLTFRSVDAEEREYLRLFGELSQKKRVACLVAITDYNAKVWCVEDGKKQVSVPSWIKKHEREYSILFLFCSDPDGPLPKSEHALLVFGGGQHSSIIDFGFGRHSFVHPLVGDLNDTLPYELEQLRKKKAKRAKRAAKRAEKI